MTVLSKAGIVFGSKNIASCEVFTAVLLVTGVFYGTSLMVLNPTWK
jgi:hypothetical protein